MNKLQGAFIGFGAIAEKGHWPSYAQSQECEIVAVMDPSAARQEAARALKPGLRIYGSVQDLFSAEKLDFVDICTPPASHASLAALAVEHGCHVLCEKPLSLKPSEYQSLAKETAARGKTVFTVHNWKYAPIFQKALDIIRAGRIGSVWHVEIFTLRDSHCKGAPAGAAPVASGKSEDWRKDPSIAGGGILIDHGWHSFYLLMNLVGAEPRKILAKMLVPQDEPNGLEEAVQALVQFPEADGYIHLTWRAPARRNSMVVQGLAGTLLLDDDRILLSAQDGTREEFHFDAPLSAGSHHADWFKNLLPDFLEEIKNPAVRGTNFREAGWCLGLTIAAYQSQLQNAKEIEIHFPSAPSEQPALA